MKKVLMAAIIVFVLISCFSVLASHPIIAPQKDLPAHYLEAIKTQTGGVYSRTLPLVPVFVSVDDVSQGKVYYTVFYFPFGTVGLSYTDGEGYNIEKPLIGA